MLEAQDKVEVTKKGDPNEGREGWVTKPLPMPPTIIPIPPWFEVAFEDGAERAEYAERDLRRVAR